MQGLFQVSEPEKSPFCLLEKNKGFYMENTCEKCQIIVNWKTGQI